MFCSICSQSCLPILPHEHKNRPALWSALYHLLVECLDPDLMLVRQAYVTHHVLPKFQRWPLAHWTEQVATIALLKSDGFQSDVFAYASGAFLVDVFNICGVSDHA